MKTKVVFSAAAIVLLLLGAGSSLTQSHAASLAQATATKTIRATQRPRATARPKATRVPRKIAPTATVAAQPTAVPAPFQIKVQKLGYDKFGRPAGLDDPNAGCGPFNDSRAMLRLEVSIEALNLTSAGVPKEEYWVRFFKTDGSEAFSCVWLYRQTRDIPDLQPNIPTNLTFMGFVELNERIGYVILDTKSNGQSNRIDIPSNLNVP